jgi:hypothetical protein
MEPTQCSKTSAFNTQTPGKYPEEFLSLQLHGESLKTRNLFLFNAIVTFWKRKKSHDIKSGGEKGVVELHFVFSQKLMHKVE